MKRIGQVIKVKPEKLDYYKELHANAWEGILERLRQSNIQNYSIFYRDGFLFSYYEYTGEDYEKDMQAIAEDPLTKEWWKETDPCQEPIETAKEGEWWAEMEQVFFMK